VAFSSLPVLAYGVLEQTFPPDILMKYPILYKLNRGNKMLQVKRIILWLFFAYFEAAVMFFPLLASWSLFESIGHGFGLGAFSLTLSGNVLTVISLKILVDSRHCTTVFFAAIILSIALFVACMALFSYFIIERNFIALTYANVLSAPSMWLFLLFTTVTALLPDFLLHYLNENKILGMQAV